MQAFVVDNQNTSAITYSDNWTVLQDLPPPASNVTCSSSKSLDGNGASASLKFVGHAVGIFGPIGDTASSGPFSVVSA